MNDQYVVPPRLTEIPEWMKTHEGADTEQIARDLISLTYWNVIDKRAEAQALSRVKKIKGWDVKKPLEEQDLLLQGAYEEFLKEGERDFVRLMGKDILARARAMAEGADASFDLATFLEDVMPQVQTLIAVDIKEMGLLPYLEHDSTIDYLLSKRTPWDGEGKKPGIWSEIGFMVDWLLPVMEANGFPRKLVVGVTENYNKARFATPFLREALEEVIAKANAIKAQIALSKDIDEKKRLDEALTQALQLDPKLKKLLETLVVEMSKTAKQGGMGVHAFRDSLRKIARNAPDVVKVTGYIYNLPKGGIMMISPNDIKTLNAIKMLTDKLVDWHLGTPEDLAQEVGKRLIKDMP